MSRPSVISENNMQHSQRLGRVLDFANVPVMQPYPQTVSSCAYVEDPYCVQPQYGYHNSVGAPMFSPMQGGVYGMPPAPSIPISSVYPGPVPVPGFVGAAPVKPYQTVDAPAPVVPSSSTSISSRITEDELDHKINTQINTIMATQKAESLCSKVERLTDKVQKLSRNMEIASSASRVDSHVDSHMESPMNSSRDGEINSRLRRLAAESNRRVNRRFSPDF